MPSNPYKTTKGGVEMVRYRVQLFLFMSAAALVISQGLPRDARSQPVPMAIAATTPAPPAAPSPSAQTSPSASLAPASPGPLAELTTGACSTLNAVAASPPPFGITSAVASVKTPSDDPVVSDVAGFVPAASFEIETTFRGAMGGPVLIGLYDASGILKNQQSVDFTTGEAKATFRINTTINAPITCVSLGLVGAAHPFKRLTLVSFARQPLKITAAHTDGVNSIIDQATVGTVWKLSNTTVPPALKPALGDVAVNNMSAHDITISGVQAKSVDITGTEFKAGGVLALPAVLGGASATPVPVTKIAPKATGFIASLADVTGVPVIGFSSSSLSALKVTYAAPDASATSPAPAALALAGRAQLHLSYNLGGQTALTSDNLKTALPANASDDAPYQLKATFDSTTLTLGEGVRLDTIVTGPEDADPNDKSRQFLKLDGTVSYAKCFATDMFFHGLRASANGKSPGVDDGSPEHVALQDGSGLARIFVGGTVGTTSSGVTFVDTQVYMKDGGKLWLDTPIKIKTSNAFRVGTNVPIDFKELLSKIKIGGSGKPTITTQTLRIARDAFVAYCGVTEAAGHDIIH